MFELLWDYREPLWNGFLITLQLVVLSSLVSLPLALLVALGRLSRHRWLRGICLVYIELFRSTPLLVLFVIFFYTLGGVAASLGLSAFWIAVAGLILNESAYLADSYRGVIASVPVGQWRAAAAFGLSKRQAMIRVVLPQALTPALPLSVNAVVYILKSSSLASLITVQELVGSAYLLIYKTFKPFEVFTGVLIIYVILAVFIAYIPRFIRRKARAQ